MQDRTEAEGPRDPWAFQRWAFDTPTGNPIRKAVLVHLAVMADTNTGRCEAKQGTIAQACETTDRTVRDHLRALEAAGLIARRAQHRYDGSRRGDEFLLLAPGVTEWPDGLPVQPEAASGPPTRKDDADEVRQSSGQERPPVNDHAQGKARTRAAASEQIPDEFPDELRPHARAALVVLRSVAEAHRAKAVSPRALALTIMARPRKPIVRAAHDFAAWSQSSRPLRDVVAAYRNWLDRESDLAAVELMPGEVAPGPPAGVTPLRGGRRDAEGERQARQARRAEIARGGA